MAPKLLDKTPDAPKLLEFALPVLSDDASVNGGVVDRVPLELPELIPVNGTAARVDTGTTSELS